MASRYRYYAVTGRVHTLDNPLGVVRVGGQFAESFTTSLKWERTEPMRQVDMGDFDAVEISEKDAKRFEKAQARRVEEARERDGN